MEFFEHLYRRYNETKQYKDRWLALYQDLYLYVIPDRDAFNVKFNYIDVGKPVTQMIWDSTAMLAAYQRANDLHGLLLPKDRTWGKFTMDPHQFSAQDIEGSKADLDEINDNIFYHINHSNLSRVVSSSNLDLVGGTGAIWVESRSDLEPLYFRSIPAVALYIEYSTDDVLNTCWYQCKFTGRQILDAFPDYKGDRKDSLYSGLNEIFIVVYGQIKLSEERFYLYAFIQDDPYVPLFEKESYHPQIIIYRDKVRPGEADGRGVGVDLLPTIKDLNRMVEYDRKYKSMRAFPPAFYDSDKSFNPYQVRQWAGAMFARMPQGRDPISFLQSPDFPDVQICIQHLQDTIKRGFQVDPLGEIEQPTKSATEISIRENRAQRTSATDISRLINELPKQIFEVSAKIMSERKLLNNERTLKLNFNGKKLRFDFRSPLYDMQAQSDLQHLITNWQIKQQFFGQGAVAASTNMEEAGKFLAEKLNLPAKLFASQEQVQKIMKSMLEQSQQVPLPQPQTSAIPQQPIQQPPYQI